MNKLLRVFISQIFNSFFPLLIVAILLHIYNKQESAPIFVIINFANFYLLFTDYSSNIRFIKDAVRLGGIHKGQPVETTNAISNYIAIKIVFLVAGFIPWIGIAAFTPVLKEHFWASVAGYSFIVAYNFNFYWVYTASKKEYFFILSNFFSRLALVVVLLLFYWLGISKVSLVFFAGLLGSAISFFFFYRFCIVYEIKIRLNRMVLRQSLGIIVSDVRLVTSTFTLMTPTLGLTFFLGYVRYPEQIAIYALAEKIFFGLRTLLSVAINSVYPVLCNKAVVSQALIRKMLFIFYATLIAVCAGTYLLMPLLFQLLKVSETSFPLFQHCLAYFLPTLLVISLNAPLMLWLMISNELQTKRTLTALSFSAVVIVSIYMVNLFGSNSVISLVQTLLAGESVIFLTFLLLYKTRRPNLSSQTIVPAV